MKNLKDTLIYALKRLLLMVFTFIVIFIICFVLIRLLPIPNTVGVGQDADIFGMRMVAMGRYYKTSSGEYRALPIIVQLGNYVKNIFVTPRDLETGEALSKFGYSWFIAKNSSPDTLLFSRFTPTVILNVYTMIIAVPIGLLLGMFMALFKDKWIDNVLSVLIMILISVPSFVDALFFQWLFGYKLGVLPPMRYGLAEAGGWFTPKMTSSFILPIISMSLGSICGYARYTRAELTEVLTSDFMLLARTKGLSRGQATVRHAFRNSLVPIFPMLLGEILSILGGSMIIENIYGINGVGGLYLESILKRDFDVFQFVAMFYIIIGLLGGLIVDISYGIVDPRIRMGGGKN